MKPEFQIRVYQASRGTYLWSESNQKMKRLFINIFTLVLAAQLSSCGYNEIVAREEAMSGQWAQVENVYQRRAELIPNLVNTVKGYADFEQETLTQVVNARAKATSTNVSADNLSPESLANFQQA